MRSQRLLPIALVSILVAAAAFAGKLIYDSQRVYYLTIATAGRGGEYYAFGETLSQVLSRHNPRLRLRLVETSGSRENIELLEAKKVQLAIAQSDTLPTPSVRAVASLFPEVFHLIAAEPSQIRRVPDLKGKRIALMSETSGSYVFFWQLMQHYGLTKSDFQAVTLSPQAAHEQLRQGRVDAVFRSIALGNPEVRQLLQATPARLVPLEQVEAIKISHPQIEALEIPQGTYRANPPLPERDLPVASVQAILLTHTGVNEGAIYEITRSLYEHRNELSTLNPRAATVSSLSPGKGFGLPLHPGAKAYYSSDEPSFLEKYAEVLGLLLSIGLLCASSIWQLRSRLQARKKNRADAYNLRVLELVEQVHSSRDLAQLEAVRTQLFEILKKVIEDLDYDKISPESFQSFTFPWEVAIATVRHREMILSAQKVAYGSSKNASLQDYDHHDDNFCLDPVENALNTADESKKG